MGGRSHYVDFLISLSPFPEVIRMSMPTVSFLTQVESDILSIQNTFYDL